MMKNFFTHHASRITFFCILLAILIAACRQAADQPAFAIETSGDTTVDFMVMDDEDTAVFDIISPRGIGDTTITRHSSEWPQTVILRFHLTGLENLDFSYTDINIKVEISSHGGNEIRQSVTQDGLTEIITNSSEFWMPVAISPTEGEATIPLAAGTIDVQIPPAFYQRNPKTFQIQWIDFYR